MGASIFNLLWEAYQTVHIHRSECAAEALDQQVTSVRSDFDGLKKRLDYIMLCNQALWELICERTNLTDSDLREKIREIDCRDGREDGKIGTQQVTCPTCQRPSNSRRKRCLFCGTNLNNKHLFE